MCLTVEFSQEEQEEIKKKLSEKITVYKIVKKDRYDKRYTPVWFDFQSFHEGENIYQRQEFPDAGFYSFKSKFKAWIMYRSLKAFNDDDVALIKCIIYKKDIIRIGEWESDRSYVTIKITIPKYKD